MAEPTLVLTKNDLMRAVVRHWKGDNAVRLDDGTDGYYYGDGGSGDGESFSEGTVQVRPSFGLVSPPLTATLEYPGSELVDMTPFDGSSGPTPPYQVTGTLTTGTLPTWVDIRGGGSFQTTARVNIGGVGFFDLLFAEPGGTQFMFMWDRFEPPPPSPAVGFEYVPPDGAYESSLVELTGSTFPTWMRGENNRGLLTIAGTEYHVMGVYSGTFLIIDEGGVTFPPGTSYSLTMEAGGTGASTGTSGVASDGLLTPRELQIVEECVNSGYRRFLYPAPIAGEDRGHQWSFMRPTRTLGFTAPYSTGTVEIVAGVATLTDGTWPGWVTDGDLVVDSTSYRVTGRNSVTEVLLDSAVNVDAGTTYQLVRPRYPFPDDFGAIEGAVTYAPANNDRGRTMVNVGEMEYRELRQGQPETGRPCEFCIAAVTPKAQQAGQRYEMRVWPPPDRGYRVRYRYNLLPDAMTVGTALHYGGSVHSETLLEACLFAWEELLEDEQNGLHANAFRERMQWSVNYDRQAGSPENIGFNADHSDPYDGVDDSGRWRHRLHSGGTTININF